MHERRYNRWWSEEHLGQGIVRKRGDSTTGENWDITEPAETNYNPVPHFGFEMAVSHSQQLWRIPVASVDQATRGGQVCRGA